MEIWRDIKKYIWLYQISNLWRVKTLWNNKNKKERIRKLNKNKKWYLDIILANNNINSSFLVHRLVATAFIPNPENKPEVNHKLGIRDDNRVTELEWVTKSENEKHKHDVLWCKMRSWKDHPSYWKFWKYSKSSKEVIQYNLEWVYIKLWYSIIDAHKELNICETSISSCCNLKLKTAWWFIWKFNK